MSDYIKKIRTDKGDKQIDYTALANRPSSMKNPYALTFSGAASSSYDGTAPVNVRIPPIPTWADRDTNPSYTKSESDEKYATKQESDEKFAPISAAIQPTVTGNPAVCENSAEWRLQGLKIYGKSTQDGSPSPENPVPIVSAGADGSIDLAVSNGASLLQSMTISTPNGLPGIPVDSGGNYTDASGQQWISDKITESKKIHFLRYLDDSDYDNIKLNAQFSNDSVTICYIPAANNIVKKYHAAILSNMFIQGRNGGALLTVGEMSLEANGSVYFGLPPTVKSSLDAQNYMKTNSVKVLVQLAVPTETSLSVEELAAYRALHTYDGATAVSTAEPVAGIEATYVMDGNKYRESVDKRLAALEAAQTGI